MPLTSFSHTPHLSISTSSQSSSTFFRSLLELGLSPSPRKRIAGLGRLVGKWPPPSSWRQDGLGRLGFRTNGARTQSQRHFFSLFLLINASGIRRPSNYTTQQGLPALDYNHAGISIKSVKPLSIFNYSSLKRW